MKARLEPKRVKGKTSCRTIQEELNDNPYITFAANQSGTGLNKHLDH